MTARLGQIWAHIQIRVRPDLKVFVLEDMEKLGIESIREYFEILLTELKKKYEEK